MEITLTSAVTSKLVLKQKQATQFITAFFKTEMQFSFPPKN